MISPVRNRQQDNVQDSLSSAQIQRRIELHTRDHLERSESSSGEARALGLPPTDPEHTNALREIYGQATPQEREDLVRASHEAAAALYAYAEGSTSLSETTAGLSNAAEQYIAVTGETELTKVTNASMMLAIDGIQADVQDLAMELSNATQYGKSKREEISEFRNTLADWPQGAETQEFTWTTFDDAGSIVEQTDQLNRPQAEAKLKELDQQLATNAETSEDFKFRLQMVMQNQQQVFQVISEIEQNFHATARGMLQNLRA
ncbi:MAG: hypothetical protein R3C68_10755 [Myxococcota bacterium]